MKRKSICILLIFILMNQTYNVYALDQVRDVSNHVTSTSSHYQQNFADFNEKKNTEPLLGVEIKQGNNFIQPEGITNICSEITFKTQCKEASYKIDMNNLIDENENSIKLMNYNLDQVGVQIIDLKNSMILNKSTYRIESIVDNHIKICFTDLIIEEGSAYKITIYIPTTIGREVIYGGSDANSYLNKYIQNQQIGVVRVLVEAYPKIDEVLDKNHQIIEWYSDKALLKEQTISLNYIEISKIY